MKKQKVSCKSERCIKENKINVERFSFFAFFFFLLVCIRMIFSSSSFRGMHSIDLRKVKNLVVEKDSRRFLLVDMPVVPLRGVAT